MSIEIIGSRIFIDFHFIKWIKENEAKYGKVFYKLLHINANSKEHKKKNNLIFKRDFDKAIEELKIEENILLGSASRQLEPDYLDNIRGEISKNLVFLNRQLSERPYKAYVFTSPEKVKDYENNKHLENIKAIKILSKNEAIKKIDEYFRLIGKKNLLFE